MKSNRLLSKILGVVVATGIILGAGFGKAIAGDSNQESVSDEQLVMARGRSLDVVHSTGERVPGYCPSIGGSTMYESIYDVSTIMHDDGTMTLEVIVWLANPTGCTYGEECPEYDLSPEYVNAWIDWDGDENWIEDEYDEQVMDQELDAYEFDYFGRMNAIESFPIPDYAVYHPKIRVNLGWGYDPNVCDYHWAWGDVYDASLRSVAVVELGVERNFAIRDNSGIDIVNPIWKKQFNDNGELMDVTPAEDDPIAVSVESGYFYINAILDGFPNNPSWVPQVSYDWTFDTNSGSGTFNSWSGRIRIECPDRTGICKLLMNFRIKDPDNTLIRSQRIGRQVFVTLKNSRITKPKLVWLENALRFAGRGSRENPLVAGMNNNIYGSSGWIYNPGGRYTYDNWKDLVEGGPGTSGHCYPIAAAWCELSKIIGVAADIRINDFTKIITITPAVALDGKTGNIRHENNPVNDRWQFDAHVIGKYGIHYDPTFGKTYVNRYDYEEWAKENGYGYDDPSSFRNKWYEYVDYAGTEYVKLYVSDVKRDEYWGPYPLFEGLLFADETENESNSLVLSTADADFTGNLNETALDTDGNDIYNQLAVDVEVDVTVPGTYRLNAGLLFDDSLHISSRENMDMIVPTDYIIEADAGLTTFNIFFSGEDIFNKGFDGNYDISLALMDENHLIMDTLGSELSSYLHEDFGEVPARVVGCDDYGNDIEPDGYYDFLTVNATINTFDEMMINVEGVLSANNEFICAARDSIYMNVGQTTFELNFEGSDINYKKTDGPYIFDVQLFGQNQNLIHSFIDTTSYYDWVNFEKRNARIESISSDYATDSDADNLYDYLSIECSIDVSESDTYRLIGWLGNNSDSVFSWAENAAELDIGQHSMILEFPGTEINSSGYDGPYVLSKIILSDTLDNILDIAINAYETAEYSHEDFEIAEQPMVYLTGNYACSVIDTNANMYYDYIRCDVELVSRDWGYMVMIGALYDSLDNDILWSRSFDTVYAGSLMVLPLDFEGRDIYSAMSNGPYKIRSLVAYHTGDPNEMEYVPAVCSTGYYEYSSFEHWYQEPFTDILPDTMYALFAYTYSPMFATIYLVGDLVTGYDPDDVDTSAFVINGFLQPDSCILLSKVDRYIGPVWQLKVNMRDFIFSYPLWWDIEQWQYDVSGMVGDSAVFNVSGSFMSYGHKSGDVNKDGSENVLDVTYLIAYLYADGPAPEPFESGNLDGKAGINILDCIYLISYIYKGGPPPVWSP